MTDYRLQEAYIHLQSLVEAVQELKVSVGSKKQNKVRIAVARQEIERAMKQAKQFLKERPEC